MKYKNQKYIVDGQLFDSKKEANQWCELKLLEKAGEICHLERQKPFELIPTRYYGGVCVRGCKYIADFYYYDNRKNEYVAQDTKGYMPDSYIIKKKIFLEKYVNTGICSFFESGNNQLFYKKNEKK